MEDFGNLELRGEGGEGEPVREVRERERSRERVRVSERESDIFYLNGCGSR